MERSVINYALVFKPGALCRIVFRLEGEQSDRIFNLGPAEFAAASGVLSEGNVTFDVSKGAFIGRRGAQSRNEMDLFVEI